MSTTEIALITLLFTVVATIIGFFLKRLVASVDSIEKSVSKIPVELEKRPTWDGVKDLCIEVADNKITRHERDEHKINHPNVEEYNQGR